MAIGKVSIYNLDCHHVVENIYSQHMVEVVFKLLISYRRGIDGYEAVERTCSGTKWATDLWQSQTPPYQVANNSEPTRSTAFTNVKSVCYR